MMAGSLQVVWVSVLGGSVGLVEVVLRRVRVVVRVMAIRLLVLVVVVIVVVFVVVLSPMVVVYMLVLWGQGCMHILGCVVQR